MWSCKAAEKGDFNELASFAIPSICYSKIIPDVGEKEKIWQGSALNLIQAEPTPKQLNLNKLSDGGGSQMERLSDAVKNLLFTDVRYIYPTRHRYLVNDPTLSIPRRHRLLLRRE